MKKIIALMLVTSLMLGLLAGCGSISGTTGNTNSDSLNSVTDETFSGGNGTESDPYRIATADDLWRMADLVNAINEQYRDAHYILTADIDLGGEAWSPIGDGYLDSYTSFPGTFDGDGHTIRGLNLSTDAEDKTRFFGLFGQVEGTVRNLTLAESTIDCSGKDSANTGAVVGCVYYGGTIENCHVASDVTVTGSYTTGGLAGQMNGMMTGCTNSATVVGTSEVGQTGGLAGMIAGNKTDANSGSVTNCSNFGTVQSAGDAGGVTGALLIGGIRTSTNDAAISGENAGGIAGVINAAETDGTVYDHTISNCTNSGTVTGTEDAGGIAATAGITTGNVTISDCTNAAAVLAKSMGGILGSGRTTTDSATLTVTGCTNSGELVKTDGDGSTWAGGIVASLTGKAGGSYSISGNKNTGTIDVGTGCAGGILGTYLNFLSDEGTAVTLNVENCTNEAAVSGSQVGGVVSQVSAASYPAVTFTVTGCANSGDLFGRTANVRIGGIVGVIEPHHCTAVFTGCSNSGSISCEDVVITKEEEWFDFSAAMGGILGYAGVNGVSLTPEDDCGLGDTTVLTFENCENTGIITTGNEKVTYYTGDICGLSVVGTKTN